jgi:hypothetical protein
VEPVNRPFDSGNLSKHAEILCPADKQIVNPYLLLKRKARTRYWGSVSLNRRPLHNDVFLAIEKARFSDVLKIKQLIERMIETTAADYAYIGDAQQQDEDRFAELKRPYTPEELRCGERRAPPFIPQTGRNGTTRYWFSPILQKMYGPNGYLWDIVWYNYFGRPYIDLIGTRRLRGAGWARVEEVAGGLACYATETMDDPSYENNRRVIREALNEFVWTPGCKREEKKAPNFDFSAQVSQGQPKAGNKDRVVVFSGLTKDEQDQALKLLRGKEENKGRPN